MRDSESRRAIIPGLRYGVTVSDAKLGNIDEIDQNE